VPAVRLPSLALDFWELESGEERHERSPDSFWIPPRAERETLQPGQTAKLLFVIEGEHPGGEICVEVGRMWVFVTEAQDGEYVGILDNQPASLEPSPDVYLSEGVEIPFHPEHVIDIDDPPEEYALWKLSQPPKRTWPRD